LVLAAAAAIALVSCRPSAPAAAVDPVLASCVSADTLALAGVNLAQLRASPLYRQLPPGAAALLGPLGGASYLLLAWNGKDVLAIARGAFREPPAGAVLLAKDLAVSGSAEAVRAAAAQRKTGQTGARWLLDCAAGPAAANQIWVVARGGVAYPLTGDAANVNRFLRLVEYASLAVNLDSNVRLEALGAGLAAESAQQLEETLRASFSLAAAGASRDRALADLLHSVQIQRDGKTVRATLSAAPEQVDKLLGWIAP
jgi:hypothetical protein